MYVCEREREGERERERIEREDRERDSVCMYMCEIMLINISNENNDIMKCPHSYYLFKHIYFVIPSIYFSIFSVKAIDKIDSKTYRYIKYHRDGQNSKYIMF